MRCALFAAVMILTASLTAAQSGAAPAIAGGPVFHQLVLFTLPPEFKSGNSVSERANGAFYSREYVPQGESLDHWTQMIELTGTQDLATNPDATPRALVSRLAAGFRRHCPDTFVSDELGPQSVSGFDGFAVIASCGHVQGNSDAYSETAIILALKGAKDYYAIQWARHGADSKRAPSLDTKYWTQQLHLLQPIRLCPIVAGEAPPFPSCRG
jgi:hypothetical protein